MNSIDWNCFPLSAVSVLGKLNKANIFVNALIVVVQDISFNVLPLEMVLLNRVQAFPKGFFGISVIFNSSCFICGWVVTSQLWHVITTFLTAYDIPNHQIFFSKNGFCDECAIFRICCCSVNGITMQFSLNNRLLFTESWLPILKYGCNSGSFVYLFVLTFCITFCNLVSLPVASLISCWIWAFGTAFCAIRFIYSLAFCITDMWVNSPLLNVLRDRKSAGLLFPGMYRIV